MLRLRPEPTRKLRRGNLATIYNGESDRTTPVLKILDTFNGVVDHMVRSTLVSSWVISGSVGLGGVQQFLENEVFRLNGNLQPNISKVN